MLHKKKNYENSEGEIRKSESERDRENASMKVRNVPKREHEERKRESEGE